MSLPTGSRRQPKSPLSKRYKPTTMPQRLFPSRGVFWPQSPNMTQNPALDSMWAAVQFEKPEECIWEGDEGSVSVEETTDEESAFGEVPSPVPSLPTYPSDCDENSEELAAFTIDPTLEWPDQEVQRG